MTFASFKLDHRRFSLRPSKKDDPIDGISTQDLLAISKHILGKETLENEFQKEAADANGDGKISVIDLIAVRKLILGKVDSLSVSQPWIFYNQQMEGSSELQLPNYHDQLNFTGVKIGDVNGDAARISGGKRSADKGFTITYQNQHFRTNEMVRIPITVTEDITMEGLQFQLEMKGITLTGIESSLPDMSDENWSLIEGHLTVSWITESPLYLEPGDTLATLVGTSKMSSELRNQLSLSGGQVKSEIYSDTSARTLQLIGVEMTPNISSNTLFAFPNPFRSRNMVRLSLSRSQQGTLRIFGIDGQTHFIEEKLRSSGTHETLIRREDLGPAGVYFVEYRSQETVMNYKIVLLE